jgi:hypothetical protein
MAFKVTGSACRTAVATCTGTGATACALAVSRPQPDTITTAIEISSGKTEKTPPRPKDFFIEIRWSVKVVDFDAGQQRELHYKKFPRSRSQTTIQIPLP